MGVERKRRKRGVEGVRRTSNARAEEGWTARWSMKACVRTRHVVNTADPVVGGSTPRWISLSTSANGDQPAEP
eukprot:6209635-Pleurochrysis_carterae.AAC.1